MQTLVELARDALRGLLHPRAADYVDPHEPDAGMTMALAIDTLHRGEPAAGRVELGGVRDVQTEGMWLGYDDTSRLRPPPKLTDDEQCHWKTGAVRKVNCTWTEWSSPGDAAEDWQMHLRIESPVIQEFWLELVLDARHRRWLHQQLCGGVSPGHHDAHETEDETAADAEDDHCPPLVVRGRMSNFGLGDGLVGLLRAQAPNHVQLRVDSRHRPAVWFEMNIQDAERIRQITAEPVSQRTRAARRKLGHRR